MKHRRKTILIERNPPYINLYFGFSLVNSIPLIIFADYENKVYFKIYSCERSRLLKGVSSFNIIVSMVVGFTSTYAITDKAGFAQLKLSFFLSYDLNLEWSANKSDIF
jgi:hypothetical protein